MYMKLAQMLIIVAAERPGTGTKPQLHNKTTVCKNIINYSSEVSGSLWYFQKHLVLKLKP